MINTLKNESKIIDPSSMNNNPKQIYKSKIASIPTPGYSGHTSIFIKPVSYLNMGKINHTENKN